MGYLSIKIQYLSRAQVSNIFQKEIPFHFQGCARQLPSNTNAIPIGYHFINFCPKCIFQGETFETDRCNPVRLQYAK